MIVTGAMTNKYAKSRLDINPKLDVRRSKSFRWRSIALVSNESSVGFGAACAARKVPSGGSGDAKTSPPRALPSNVPGKTIFHERPSQVRKTIVPRGVQHAHSHT